MKHLNLEPCTLNPLKQFLIAFGPPAKQEKVGGAGLRARRFFGGTGFQPVRRTGQMLLPPRTFSEKSFMGLWPTHEL
jgi:hypothetical protein